MIKAKKIKSRWLAVILHEDNADLIMVTDTMTGIFTIDSPWGLHAIEAENIGKAVQEAFPNHQITFVKEAQSWMAAKEFIDRTK